MLRGQGGGGRGIAGGEDALADTNAGIHHVFFLGAQHRLGQAMNSNATTPVKML
jgi:hypothetical protein